MRTTRTAWWAIGLAGLIAVTLPQAGPACAQVQLGGYLLEGQVEVGGKIVDDPKDSDRAKFIEYRDWQSRRDGILLEDLRLRLFRPDESYSVELLGPSLRAERLGLWQFGFDFGSLEHVYSTNGRLLARESGGNTFTLPSPRPALGDASLHNSAPTLDRTDVEYKTYQLFFKLTPTPGLELKAEYSLTDKSGHRPFGVPFGSPGNDFYEILEPIDQKIHELRVSGAISRETWQLQGSYTLSMFRNDVTSVYGSNPLQATDGAWAPASASSVPGSGRVSLPPDNSAHTFALGGGVNLPFWRTRLNANVSYSIQLQNDDFLPHTRNPVIVANAPAGALTLPEDSLDGRVDVLTLFVNAVTRPLQPLTLSAKYRLFDRNSKTDEIVFPGNVESDRILRVEERRASGADFTKHNLDLDGKWRFMPSLALTLGGGWEHWNRDDSREVEKSDELFAKAVLDYSPRDWLSTRLSYRPSFRRYDGYNTYAHLEHVDVGTPSDNAKLLYNSPYLRKYDEAERNRQRVDLQVDLTPVESFSTTLNVGWRYDDYFKSTLGLQNEYAWTLGVDLGWRPVPRLSFNAGWVRDILDQKMKSRNREVSTCPVGPCPPNTDFVSDFADYNWVTDILDTIDTFYAAAKVVLIPNVLDWAVRATYQRANGDVDTRNPNTPVQHPPLGAPSTANVLVRPQPDTEDELFRIESRLKWSFARNWYAALGYAFESFRKDDYRTEQLTPSTTGSSSVWLANDTQNYAAHVVGLTLGYVFR